VKKKLALGKCWWTSTYGRPAGMFGSSTAAGMKFIFATGIISDSLISLRAFQFSPCGPPRPLLPRDRIYPACRSAVLLAGLRRYARNKAGHECLTNLLMAETVGPVVRRFCCYRRTVRWLLRVKEILNLGSFFFF